MKFFLFLFRHGSTEGNLVKKYIGATDEALCDIGREEVRKEREMLLASKERAGEEYRKIIAEKRKIFCSPMLRAKETASILFPDNPIQIEMGLNEMNFGLFEKKNFSEMNKDPFLSPLYQSWLDSNCTAQCPEGESKASFSKRICSSFAELANREHFALNEVVPLVCHGGTINSLLERFAKTKKDYFEWRTLHGDFRLEEIEL